MSPWHLESILKFPPKQSNKKGKPNTMKYVFKKHFCLLSVNIKKNKQLMKNTRPKRYFALKEVKLVKNL